LDWFQLGLLGLLFRLWLAFPWFGFGSLPLYCLGVLVTLGLIVQRSGMSLWCSSSWWFGFVLGTLGDLGVLGVGVVLVGLLV